MRESRLYGSVRGALRNERPYRESGAPIFGEESVVDRGPKGMAQDGGCVRPGLHRPRAGTHMVAWWDPNVLALDAEANVGVRQQRILEADEGGAEVARGEQSYSQWREHRSAAVAQARELSIRVQTATAFAADAGLGEADLARIQVVHLLILLVGAQGLEPWTR
jgi:ATP-dependent helicase/nuclease subunit A